MLGLKWRSQSFFDRVITLSSPCRPGDCHKLWLQKGFLAGFRKEWSIFLVQPVCVLFSSQPWHLIPNEKGSPTFHLTSATPPLYWPRYYPLPGHTWTPSAWWFSTWAPCWQCRRVGTRTALCCRTRLSPVDNRGRLISCSTEMLDAQ